MRERLLIVGASARAAAESAARANFLPMAVDQFGDQDLRRIADLRTCERFPEEIPGLAAELPPAGFVLTGAMENHRSILEALTASRPLLGCSLEAIAAVRDPLRVQAILKKCNLPTVATSSSEPIHTAGDRWLKKPVHGSNGAGICPLTESATPTPTESFYYQKLIPGISQSGLFLASAQSTVLIGVTEQWIGVSWLNAKPFGYAGSFGPLQLNEKTQRNWKRIGSALGQHCGLQGIFGVDAVAQNGTIYVIEVNPRFTASAEILDIAGDGQLMRDHVRACRDGKAKTSTRLPSEKAHAKAIYYTPRDIVAPFGLEKLFLDTSNENGSPRLADIPVPGTQIKKRHPVCTLLATGGNRKQIRLQFKRAVHSLHKHLTCNTNQEVDSQAN